MRYRKLCYARFGAPVECYFEGVVVRENRRGLTEEQHCEMLRMLGSLSLAEREMLADKDFITEDEADLIVCYRRRNEQTVQLDEVLKEAGIPRRQRRA
jgi:hypothetical protein